MADHEDEKIHIIEAMRLDGSRVKARRKELGLTQDQLGKRAGLTQSAISKIEKGEIDGNMRATQDGLAAALHTSPEYLCGTVESSDPADNPIDGRGLGHEPSMGTLLPEASIEAALLDAFDKARHTFADVATVRELLVGMPEPLRPRNLSAQAGRLLDATASLRASGYSPTPTGVLAILLRAEELS